MEQIKVGDIIRVSNVRSGVSSVFKVLEVDQPPPEKWWWGNQRYLVCKELYTRSFRKSNIKQSRYVSYANVLEILSPEKFRILEDFSRVFYGK